MSFSISGKTAIVTGAANGIGLAIARSFADKGANVMCADMDEKKLKEELGDARDEGNIRFFAGDLRQRLTIANLVSATIDAFEEIDILVNASRQVIPTSALDVDDNSVETLLEQNVMTAMRLSQQVAKRMIKQADEDREGQLGSIINFSSVASKNAHPELMGYSMASAAVEQLTRSMALSLAPHRIRVNAVSFGSVMSTSLKTAVAENREWRDDIRCHTPLGRIAAPSELVDTVQFLAAESSSFMTGEVMVVDGGRSLLDAVSAPAH
ncbi:SDR family NAD(P)-dependent oxidoreductase [Sulfitobacter donghicola]|uniref:Oxidoreductase n=1 Tax=Sulfitobacter donghicola DSW-25 = KCTC 12864 = JCM 14565 TaxID=1300350 RepID=A0A073IMZ4_9RHOB|nr:SDR family oxidoreductase [Sulfitobacter donghicola]KEJ90945.1 oxidoreductase [Sulfitobacter donghicola DSW-25 = KCTC 12864 = JCM 14565]KIN68235.1 7-alpha-hydroxysteroid dehydrogenase [Sulfitobacter donghicola DSW-25 = KCTC 12864 = JCM 14565]